MDIAETERIAKNAAHMARWFIERRQMLFQAEQVAESHSQFLSVEDNLILAHIGRIEAVGLAEEIRQMLETMKTNDETP